MLNKTTSPVHFLHDTQSKQKMSKWEGDFVLFLSEYSLKHKVPKKAQYHEKHT